MQTQVGQAPGINLPWQGAATMGRLAPRASVTDQEQGCVLASWCTCLFCCQGGGTRLVIGRGARLLLCDQLVVNTRSESRYLLLEEADAISLSPLNGNLLER